MHAQQSHMNALGDVMTAVNSAVAGFSKPIEELVRYTSTPIRSEKDVLQRAEAMEYLMSLATHDNDLVLVFAHAIADRIEEFEDTMPMPEVSVAERLKLLMKTRGVKQKALSSVAPQSVISEILNGKREVNLKQAKALALFFNAPVSWFIA